jgi:dienelactone hydrolase
MAHVVLFHSILGLRPGVTVLARRLGAQGHPTTAPDLYDGRSTADVDEGFAIHRAVGRDVLMDRARAAVAALPPATVLMGISAGAGIAGDLWVERPEAAGVVFLSGPGPIPEARPSDALTIFRYDGVGHNFLDEGGPDWDEAATRTCEARLLAFLSSL